MNRVGRAIVLHEMVERARDRWVIVITALFALLASGVGLYGASTEATATMVGPSLVTLASLLVPLVAIVLGHDAIVGERERNTLGVLLSLPVDAWTVVFAKFLGRAIAMSASVSAGLGVAIAFSGPGQGWVLSQLLWPCTLLGAAFLSIGILVSAATKRQVTATSLVVAIWFILVMFYDLGLLGLLVVTEGQISADTIAIMTFVNPAGLFRVEMMHAFAGPNVLGDLGLELATPDGPLSLGLWFGWIVTPLLLSGWLVTRRRAR